MKYKKQLNNSQNKFSMNSQLRIYLTKTNNN